MVVRPTVRGVWWARDETLEDGVRRLNEMFCRLAEVAPDHWSNWFRLYKTIAEREREPLFLIDRPDVIRQELVEGRYKHEGEVVADLGYSLTAVAGPPKGKGKEWSFLRVTCCVLSPYSINQVALELPVQSAAPALYDPDLLARTLAVLAEVWDPDWLAVDGLWEVVPRPWECGPALGWVNYLPARTGVIEGELPPAWQWFQGRGEKQIFVYQGGPPDPKNREHIAAFEQMVGRIRWGPPPPRPGPEVR